MKRTFIVILVCLAALQAISASSNDQWQVALITKVQAHDVAKSADSPDKYDVSLKVGNTVYVVLYTPLHGLSVVQYRAGVELLVLVGSKTVKFNDSLGNTVEAPIIVRKPIAAHDSR